MIGGTETYLRELVAHIPEALKESPEDRVTVIMDREAARDLKTPGLGRAVLDRPAAALIRARALEAFTPWRDRRVEKLFAELELDATLFPQQSIYPKRVAGRAVVTVCDLQHLILPENIARADRLFRRMIYPYSLARADRIISISQYTTQTLVEYCGLTEGEIDIVLHGFETPGQVDATPWSPVELPFIYYPAVARPHKNHLTLIESLAVLHQRDSNTPHLVLSGQQTPYWGTIRRRIDELGLTDHVTHVGYVTREQVQGLYLAAQAVVFPTRFEGFGLPITEAVAAGARIICSRLMVFEELGVPDRLRIDFEDPEALANALGEPPPFDLERAPVSWVDAARETLQVLRKATVASRRR